MPSLSHRLTVPAIAVLLLAGCSDGKKTTNHYTTNNNNQVVNPTPTPPIRNVILFIPDGSQLAHEIVASRYMTGASFDLTVHHMPYNSFATTWDITTYDKYAVDTSPSSGHGSTVLPSYLDDAFFVNVGYNAEAAGTAPYPLAAGYHDFGNLAYWLTKGLVPATDSASSATAMSTGRKTDGGNICWYNNDPSVGAIMNLGDLCREAGMPYGVVSTVPFTHATPAAMVAHNVNRGNYIAMAAEIFQTLQPDVVIGAGHPLAVKIDGTLDNYTWIAKADYDGLVTGSGVYAPFLLVGRDYANVSYDGGTALLTGAASVAANINAGTSGNDTKLVGLFGSFTTYSADQYLVPPMPGHATDKTVTWTTSVKDPTLAQCTEAALKVLAAKGKKNGKGFFCMIEGGDIDWANHADNTGWMIGAWKNQDDAIAKAISMIDSGGYPSMTHDNTLILVISDHGNSALRIRSLKDKGYIPSQADWTWNQPTPAPVDEDGTKWNSSRYDAATPDLVYCDLSDGSEFGGHTNELVTVYGWGAKSGLDLCRSYEGRWYPGTQLLDNTFLFFITCDFLGLTPPNGPLMPIVGSSN